MIEWVFIGVWFFGLCFFALYMAVKRSLRHPDLRVAADQEGWIYFLSPVGGDDGDPPAPIKIGRTSRDPKRDRLPEIETMSPVPLELLWSFYTIKSKVMEHAIHSSLRPFRMHGEWFERMPALMLIDELKGGVKEMSK